MTPAKELSPTDKLALTIPVECVQCDHAWSMTLNKLAERLEGFIQRCPECDTAIDFVLSAWQEK